MTTSPDDVRVVVVRARAPTFSAGLDRTLLTPGGGDGQESVAGLLALPDEEISETIRAYQDGFVWLQDPRFVSIAVVRGYAIGAGFQLALACDLRVVADDARFCMKESALGLVPDLAGTKPLVEAVGYARALEICATARMVEASEAVRDRPGSDRRAGGRARRRGHRPRRAPSPHRSPVRSVRPRRCCWELRGAGSTSSAAWSAKPRRVGSVSWPP